ncbi:hypothetical protein AQZ52_15515 [Novosphingobium fuchskuhlense]|uniref:Uncharacterized protein n=1 Tax=Novosphingobium fuchskuhlense TaxID=1117702 RepID=A0A124JTJ4_9SPHN|nr:hypothetical protein [Novosphingobium fuchskuhlense]KUR70262.1 hypothetical protein AQZ52_15515 [Novosphingobium fuchskuhlense]
MNTISKVLTAALALGSAVALGGTANAQDWRGGYGNGNGYGNGYGYSNSWRSPREQASIDRYLVDSTCSGQRGYQLENRLRLEVSRGGIDRWTAGRIQTAIDDLQDQEQHECRERDFSSARDIGKNYIRIRAWIDQESGSYRGNYWRR